MSYSAHGLINKYSDNALVWLPEKGIGFYPVKSSETPYDKAYFDRYREQADTEIGRKLTAARVEFVRKYWQHSILDVGIGCGQFVEAHPFAQGYDVNPAGIEYLKERGKFADLYEWRFAALCFWDSLEHIYDIELAVSKATHWVFVSMPIYESAEHCLRSKHFRKNEHIWYFTDKGIKEWFMSQGFDIIEQSNFETEIGREDIKTYAFKRK